MKGAGIGRIHLISLEITASIGMLDFWKKFGLFFCDFSGFGNSIDKFFFCHIYFK